MNIKRLIAAMALGLVTPCAMAAPAGFTYVGSYSVADGPSYTANPNNVYSAVDAAALIFGGLPSDYSVSIYSPYYDPLLGNEPLFDTLGKPIPGVISPNAIISHTGWYDYYGVKPYWPYNPLTGSYDNYNALPAPGTGQFHTNGTYQPFKKYVLSETFFFDQNPPGYSLPNGVFTAVSFDGTGFPVPTSYTTGAVSAYVRDHFAWTPHTKAYFTNYVWKNPVPPVPEPETYAMMLAGLGLVVSIARRRLSV